MGFPPPTTTSNASSGFPRTGRAAAAPGGRPPARAPAPAPTSAGRRPRRHHRRRPSRGPRRHAPARTTDVLPAPDGPITPRSGCARIRCQSASTSPSRPKKRPASASVRSRGRGTGSSSRRRLRRMPPPPARSRTASSAKARSCADWKRSSGSFSRHRRTTAPAPAGAGPEAVPPAAGPGAGSPHRRRGRRPPRRPAAPRALVSTTPSAKMSDRASAVDPRPAPVTCTQRPHRDTRPPRQGTPSPPRPVPPRSFARPKSRIFTTPVRRQEHVLRLEVPVKDPPPVRRLQPTARLHRRLQPRRAWERPVRRRWRSVSPSSSSKTT